MRYFLFGGDTYYAEGGAHDFIGYGKKLDDLFDSAKRLDVDWFHILDTETLKIVCASKEQAHGATHGTDL